MQIFTIGKNEAGQRFDKFLHKYFPGAQSGFIYKMLRKKNITLNKKKADGTEILCLGDTVESFFSDETYAKFHDFDAFGADSNININNKNINNKNINNKNINNKNINNKNNNTNKSIINNGDIIFEDENFLLLYKRAGILSQKSSPSDYSVNEWLTDYMLGKGEITVEELKTFHPSVCNRLDRNTEGIIICGKSLHGIQTLDALISEKKIEKHYLALSEGSFSHEGRSNAFIVKDSKSNISHVYFADDRQSKDKYTKENAACVITDFSIRKKYKNATLLDINLLTGKSHQIRATLSAFGNPIVGDAKYGGNTTLIKAQFLIAYKLIFPDMELLPDDMKQYGGRVFEVDIPEKFKSVLRHFEED